MGEEVKPEANEAVSAPEAVPEPASAEDEKKDVAVEKQAATEEEKPTVEEDPQPPPPPPPFILYVDLHCVGCAKKIQRSILKIRGVEEVVMDMNENQVTIKGVLDPQAVCNKIKKKTKRMAKVLSPLPAAEGEPLPPVITSQVSGLATVELNVNMHCEACADQLKKKILKMRGVQTTVTEHTTGKVIVTGTMDEEKLVDYVYRQTKKQARIVPQPDPEPGKPEAEEEKKEESGEGGEEAAETGGEKEAGDEKEGDGGGAEMEAAEEMGGWEEEGMKRMMYYYQPSYVIERVPPPQLFSDENPNACCIS
ncbi:Heavy metal transport/detoxification superfamily protein [Raphanus sativus]|uniref:Heavy metal-associated isoprenylated plant protein 9 n=1 Tax=Raphanus sativus TaxID=3726 RepID=A0A6J0N8Q9_RAPSA|nr:heavy metal-associated isoprenylated plant protein 9 [Raphanus sativus]KAJ4900493.1 Heavy metal transport/detoxification superfamily protein [Raphanus sativus]